MSHGEDIEGQTIDVGPVEVGEVTAKRRELGPVPPDDGFEGDEWVPQQGEVIAKVTVPIPPDATAVVVGPDEVLVCVTPLMLTMAEAEAHRQQMRVALGSDRFIILCGQWQIAKVAAGSRPALGQSLCNASIAGQFGCKRPEAGRNTGDAHVCGLIGRQHATHRCAGCGMSWGE